MKWQDALKTFGPLVLLAFPATAPIAPVIIHAIGEAEQIKGATGEEKKQHVAQIVADAVTTTNAVSDKIVLDPVQTGQAATTAIDAVVQVVNVIHEAKLQEADAALPSA